MFISEDYNAPTKKAYDHFSFSALMPNVRARKALELGESMSRTLKKRVGFLLTEAQVAYI